MNYVTLVFLWKDHKMYISTINYVRLPHDKLLTIYDPFFAPYFLIFDEKTIHWTILKISNPLVLTPILSDRPNIHDLQQCHCWSADCFVKSIYFFFFLDYIWLIIATFTEHCNHWSSCRYQDENRSNLGADWILNTWFLLKLQPFITC